MESLYTSSYASACDIHQLRHLSRPSLASSPAKKQQHVRSNSTSNPTKPPSSKHQHPHPHPHPHQHQRAALPPVPRHKVTKSLDFATDNINADPAISHDDTIGVGDRYKSLRSEMRKHHEVSSSAPQKHAAGYYRRADRYASDSTIHTPGSDVIYASTSLAGSALDGYNKVHNHTQLYTSDTATTAQETMTFTASNYNPASFMIGASSSGSRKMPSSVDSRQKMNDDEPIIIPTNRAEQEGIEIFSPRVGRDQRIKTNDFSNEGNNGDDFEDCLTDTSSISTALSTLAHDDPQQQHVRITGIKKTAQNYEICQAASTESTSSEEDVAVSSSLLDAATFSTDEDDDDRKLNKMSVQTRQFQQWMGTGMNHHVKDEASDLSSSWHLKPAPLEIPASQQGIQRQSNRRGRLIDSLGSRRSLLSTGVIQLQEHSSKSMDDRKSSQQFSAQQFLESAERLERKKRAGEGKNDKDRDARRPSASLFSAMSAVLTMVGKSLYSCSGKWQ